MTCTYSQNCGGCAFREMPENEYRELKNENFRKIMRQIRQPEIRFGTPVFIADGMRRRAELTFQYSRGNVILGFNARQSSKITDIKECLSLSKNINEVLSKTKLLLKDLCAVKITEKRKNRKFLPTNVSAGDLLLTETDNGIDFLLKIPSALTLEHRILLSDFANSVSDIIRVSVSCNNSAPETVAEKSRPYIVMGGYPVYIPSGTFLQASAAGEKALTDLVLKYISPDSGKIADLFCGVGTFSYPLAANQHNKITAADSSAELLDGFQKSVNAGMIPNIRILKRNLFKYPLDTVELKEFDIVVFDPPRAGAAAQVKQLALLPETDRPRKIIAVSCNPHTFVNDANTLLAGGYTLTKITMVDQFVYTPHCELVALFEKTKGENNE